MYSNHTDLRTPVGDSPKMSSQNMSSDLSLYKNNKIRSKHFNLFNSQLKNITRRTTQNKEFL